MGELVLIRHGQANSAATDEVGYDRLSELGRRQAEWVGDWLREHDEGFDAVLIGGLRRHAQTAEAMGLEATVDARLDELDYFNLTDALEARDGPAPLGEDGFAAHMPRLMQAWHAAEIRGNETFASFEARVTAVMTEAAQPGRRVLAVTSGGVIGMVIRHLLGLDPARMAHVLLPILNTSIHRIRVTGIGPILSQYNAIPHLRGEARAHARTHF